MKSFTLLKGFLSLTLVFMTTCLLAQTATITPANSNIAIGASQSFTVVTTGFGSNNNNRTFAYVITGPGATIPITPASYNCTSGCNSESHSFQFPTAGTYNVSVTVTQTQNGSAVASTSTTIHVGPRVTLSPSTTQSVLVGGTVNFTATRNRNSTYWTGGNGNFTYNWNSTPAVGVTFTNDPVTISGNNSSSVATFSLPGTYQITCTVSEGGGGLTATSAPTTVNVFAPPALPNLWATSSNGTQVSSYTVVNGLYVSGPTNMFVPSGGSTAALGRSDKPTPVNGHFYWLPNSGTNGVVNVWASTSTGTSQTNIATFDANGSSTNNLGFVRLGMGPDGTGWILAGDGTTLYLARFMSNGVNPVTVTIEDASVTLTGGAVSTFQNGDICVSGNGNLYALGNNGSGITQIFIGAPAGGATTLVKKWDLEDGVGNSFTGSVNGVAFDLLGSLYISTADGLYFIDQFTVNGPAGTVECALVDAQTGLQDLASNVFPTQSVLPVHLISFSGSLNNNVTTLNWQTENEQNFSHYELERKGSADYVAVASKPSLNSAGRSSYQHIDNLSSVPGNVFFYRLRMVDLDGRYSYSNVIMVRKDQKTITGITVNPNPVIDGNATVRFSATANSMVSLKVIDMTGKIVLQQQNQVYEGINSVSLNGLNRLLPGTYVLQMNNGQELNTFKFSVAH